MVSKHASENYTQSLNIENKFFTPKKCSCGACGFCHASIENETIDNFQNGIKILESEFNVSDKIDIHKLSPLDRLYLATYFRSIYQNAPVYKWDNKLSPTSVFTNNILKYLLKKSYTKVSIGSFMGEYLEVISVGRKNSINEVDHLGLTYEENISSISHQEYDLYKELKDPSLLEASNDDLRNIWMMIAVEECIELVLKHYTHYQIACDYSDINKSTIKEFLNFISVSQFYYLFEKKLTAYENEGYIRLFTRTSLEKLIMGEILVEIKQSGKPIPKRDKDIYEQSTISRLFFTKMLRIHDDGFYECPKTYSFKNDDGDKKD